MSRSASVHVEGVFKTYAGTDRRALDEISIDVEPGSFFSILGPSGCGKTTLLRILAGFEHPSAGRVLIDGRDVTGVSPRERDIAMVFQDYALYPHMSVRDNITFNLRNRRVPRLQIEDRLARTVAILGIERHLPKLPGQLSGGERQRVALGRALIREPRVFLMDEPLSNLDLKLREAMRLELGRLHKRLGITIIFVTHDQTEAMTLSDRLAILSDGQLQQMDAPERIYTNPANAFVAKFIGSPSMNLFRAAISAGAIHLPGGARIETGSAAGLAEGAQVMLGARAHELAFVEAGPGTIPVRVVFTEKLGRSNFVVCAPVHPECLVDGETVQIETEPGLTLLPESRAHVAFHGASLKIFDADGLSLRQRE